jgi:hypothetical protein
MSHLQKQLCVQLLDNISDHRSINSQPIGEFEQNQGQQRISKHFSCSVRLQDHGFKIQFSSRHEYSTIVGHTDLLP